MRRASEKQEEKIGKRVGEYTLQDCHVSTSLCSCKVNTEQIHHPSSMAIALDIWILIESQSKYYRDIMDGTETPAYRNTLT